MASGNDFFRSIMVLLGAIAQIVFGALPFILGWENTNATRADEVRTLVVPAGYAFSIWSVIFLGCLAFAIYQILPRQRVDALLRQVGWLAALAFWGNAIWELYVPLNSFDIISVLIILVILVASLTLMFRVIDFKEPNFWRRLAYIPLMLLAGWVSVASLVNISVTFNFYGLNPFGLSPQTEAVIVLIAAGITTATLAYFSRSWAYVAATTWGFVAIYVINNNNGESTVAIVALVMGILGIVAVLVGTLLALRR